MSSLITIIRNSNHFFFLFLFCFISYHFNIEFLDAIRSVNPPSRWKILVVDEHSQQLLNSVLKQFDILQENVTRSSFSTSSDLSTLFA
jgi:hypothetical protein